MMDVILDGTLMAAIKSALVHHMERNVNLLAAIAGMEFVVTT